MPEQTSIHGWDIPTPDEDENWGVILNEFFDNELDRDVIFHGQTHERPAAGSDAPTLFFDTDKEQFDYNDGTAWVESIIPPHEATYVTTADETATLPNALLHSGLTGTDLHDPAAHAASHESGGADEITHNNLSIAADDHHAPYTDEQAQDAIGTNLGEGLAYDDASGSVSSEEWFSYDPGHTNWADGLSLEEVNRIAALTGETIVIDRVSIRLKGGGSNADVAIQVIDLDAGSPIAQQTAGGTTKDPGSATQGGDVAIRISNSSGAAVDAAPRVTGRIQGA